MEKKDLRIVYMGTPEFAVESLKRLVEGGYQVVGVITNVALLTEVLAHPDLAEGRYDTGWLERYVGGRS